MNPLELKKRLAKSLKKFRTERNLDQYPQVRMNNQQMKNQTGTISGGIFGSDEEAQEVIDYLKEDFDLFSVKPLIEKAIGYNGFEGRQIRFYYDAEEETI